MRLVILLIGANMLAVCNAACFVKLPEINLGGKELEGCTYKKETHKLDSEWTTKDCEACKCFLDGTMECCTKFGVPFGFDEEKCEAVFDKESCSFKLIPKNPSDSSVKCTAKGMVG